MADLYAGSDSWRKNWIYNEQFLLWLVNISLSDLFRVNLTGHLFMHMLHAWSSKLTVQMLQWSDSWFLNCVCVEAAHAYCMQSALRPQLAQLQYPFYGLLRLARLSVTWYMMLCALSAGLSSFPMYTCNYNVGVGLITEFIYIIRV